MFPNPALDDLTFGNEFRMHQPEQKEKLPPRERKGGLLSLPYIRCNRAIPLPPIDASLERLLKNLWQAGQVNTAAPRSPHLFIGTRGGQIPVQDNTRPYQPLPNPQPTAFNNAFLKGTAKDWKEMLNIERVVAYCFRGDKRNPHVLHASNGFHPPSIRTDDDYLYGPVFEGFQLFAKKYWNKDITLDQYRTALNQSMDPDAKRLLMQYHFWRSLMKREEMHMGRMMTEELLKGYISASKSTTTSREFGAGGWVYCLLIPGGYEAPEYGRHDWTELYGEHEIAFLGSIPWANVCGWRKVNAQGQFEGDIYLRHSFMQQDPTAGVDVYYLLSGQAQ